MKELIAQLEKLPEVQESKSLMQCHKTYVDNVKRMTGNDVTEITGTYEGFSLMIGMIRSDGNHPLRKALPRQELTKLEEAMEVACRKITELLKPDNKGVYGKFYARIANS